MDPDPVKSVQAGAGNPNFCYFWVRCQRAQPYCKQYAYHKTQGVAAVIGPRMALSTDAIVSAGNIFVGLTGVDDIKTQMLACELTNAHLQLE